MTWKGWESDVLRELRLPDTAQNRKFLQVWQRMEGGSAKFNPLNTTLNVGGATSYNAANVRNYPSAGVGAKATAATLQGPRYAGVRAALATGDPSQLQGNAQQGLFAGLETWVSGSPTGNPGYASKIWGAFTGDSSPSASSSSKPAQKSSGGGGLVAGLKWPFENWDRLLEVLGGFALLAFGLLRLSGQTGGLAAIGVKSAGR